MKELIVDSFAGGGGASLGIKMALGRGPDIAINHDEGAIEMHAANHPETRHFREDVWKVDPRKVTKGRKVGLFWCSPDCRHFSRAKVAHLVWERFGDLGNYAEPFFGSGAVLWSRPTPPRVETVNDLDCYLANFWRALQADPEGVARWADSPVNEADLHARHRWLHDRAEFREKMRTDPHHFDAKIAGWWVWGLSCWIGDNWCRPNDQAAMPNMWRGKGVVSKVARGSGTGLDARRPHLSTRNGVHQEIPEQLPALHGGAGYPAKGKGMHQKMPDCNGLGSKGVSQQLPSLSGGGLQESTGCYFDQEQEKTPKLWQKRPDISGSSGRKHMGKGVHKQISGPSTSAGIIAWFYALAERLRRVRVCCGDWSRVLKPSVTVSHGITGVFLDPPYGVEDRDKVYNHDSTGLAAQVLAWCVDAGADPKLRIALCGYDGEHNILEERGWTKIAWKAPGGYGNQKDGENKNRGRERIWFSPHCLKAGLFD